MPSDVQVFVRFKEKCIFAGEELKCIITFRNIAEHTEPQTPGSYFRHTKRNSVNQLAAAQAAAANARPPPGSDDRNARFANTGRNDRPRAIHKASYSLSTPATPVPREPSPSSSHEISFQKQPHRHQRSVSIISMTSPVLPSAPLNSSTSRGPVRPQGHRRSSTVTVSEHGKHFVQPERQLSTEFRLNRPGGRRSPLSASHSPSDLERETTPEFMFPANHSGPDLARLHVAPPSAMPRIQHRRDPSIASRATDQRTSTEIYSHSNHSGEVFMSDQVSTISEQPVTRSRAPSELIRQHYKMGPPAVRKPQATTLLMGYAQVGATFTLDASLVDQTPFEEVKKKGFLGGQSGGGVVGVKKKTRPPSGLFGSFNFASIGESIESIMSGESSGVKEMKAVTNSRAIPLLSTPQSLLFVDVHLEPGDEKSFSFSFRLPRGLPASHRGKAIKIVYNLTIGIQGAPGAQQQVSDMRQVNIPFRVFPGVDNDGEILGHDLMQPHVILKDLAKTCQVDNSEHEYITKQHNMNDLEASSVKFLEFVDRLLDRNRRRQSSSSLMMESFKPQGGPAGPTQSLTVRAIDHAIMVSNQLGILSDSTTSPNRFEIASGGRRIAVVTLDRPLHRLGETVILAVDFSNSDVVCSCLRATLETCETVEPSLAVRSAATISRVTRKVYASTAENVLFVQRAVFSPTIPVLVSPTFITTGVSLNWFIKLEFGTVKDVAQNEDDQVTEGDEAQVAHAKPALLEEIVKDERGVVEVAVESLDCDNFEVTIPITVYGDLAQDGTASADDVVGLSI